MRTTWDHGRTGLWLVGARGSVATTVAVGLMGLRAGLVPPTGCVTEHDGLDEVPLPGWDDLVLGGHDIATTPLDKRAEALVEGGMVPAALVGAVRDRLAEVEADLRPGYSPTTHTGSQAEAAARLREDLLDFRRRHDLASVVVVDVSSTEAPVPHVPEHDDLAALERALAEPGRAVLPPSSLTAYAALGAGCDHVGFTPSTGSRLPALVQLAERTGSRLGGCDGKTGETLLRTVLAPMFTSRAMRVRSWAGTNLLGGGDGATLADPVTATAKLESKARGLAQLLGEGVTAPLHIDDVPDLGDVKTAWDHVHAEGFLGSRVTLQTTWTAYDSTLAAPLVLDLARLLALAAAAGERGVLPALGFFFKDPLGSDEHRFPEQTRALHAWATDLGTRLAGARAGS